MSKLIKAANLTGIDIQSYAPTLSQYLSTDEIIEMLKKGDYFFNDLAKKKIAIDMDLKHYEDDIKQSLFEELALIKNIELEKSRKEGQAQGKLEVMEQVIAQYQAFLTALDQLKSKLVVEDIEKDLLALTLILVKKLIQQELTLKPEIILIMIRTVLKQLAGQKELTIKVSLQDYDVIHNARQQLQDYLHDTKTLLIEPDKQLESGDILVEMDSGIMNAKIDRMLEHIQRQLNQ